MVARSPPKQLRRQVVVVPNLNRTHLRDTVKKVDQCMARLQELQQTVRGGKQEPLRMRNTNPRKSPNGGNKLRTIPDEWRRMSLPAMLLGETLGEILQASQIAKNIVEVVSKTDNTISPFVDDPRTPVVERRKPRPNLGTNSTSLQSRRKREKRVALQAIRSENDAPNLRRAKSKINFKASSPPVNSRECERNRPCVKKAVLYGNPPFHSSPSSHRQKKTMSPVVARKRQTPHKFLIKSPQPVGRKFHVKLKSPTLSISPPTGAASKRSPKAPPISSPSRLANRLASPFKSRKLSHGNERATTPHKFLIKSPRPPSSMTKIRANKKSPKAAMSAAGKLRRSLSPARLANRLMSPLKSRRLLHQNEAAMKKFTSGLKKRSTAFSVKFSPRRI